jgi:hypothetical protein
VSKRQPVFHYRDTIGWFETIQAGNALRGSESAWVFPTHWYANHAAAQ